ncbi:SIS domain-containing protein [Nonomuraea sp. KC401]|uniref:sugar isomerase domain-containing protein n=1 Tax=unclassified Nonomuraea TaxID=2593643 RepID=UPI0010FD42E1|nr:MULTISPECIES: SIS domain-containing protein [unclassified Nonomuraea]NBE97478.1 sugar isomerase domain-containing protein [Nonomuraea sp. K271]TLF62731.1 SIS domain-containing protein [Nonomuraea sp. KC401]
MTYADRILDLARQVAESQAGQVRKAAQLLVTSLRADGVVNAFGSGHSEAIAMEIAGRAGGLVPSNRLTPRDLVLYGGQPPGVLTPELERDPSVARQIYDLAPVEPQDVFVLISSSGVNGTVVELARIVKDQGHSMIALTSVKHSTQMTSRHPSGSKLLDLADVVLDNGAPYGDALLELPGGGSYGAVSTITSALLAQMVVTEAVDALVAMGETPPIYLSANVAGGDEHNKALESRYAGRIRRGA